MIDGWVIESWVIENSNSTFLYILFVLLFISLNIDFWLLQKAFQHEKQLKEEEEPPLDHQSRRHQQLPTIGGLKVIKFINKQNNFTHNPPRISY